MQGRSRSIIFAAAVTGAMLFAPGGPASAALYSYSGTIALCPSTVILCDAVFSVGDPVLGTIEVDDAALQPDGMFGFKDVTDFSFAGGTIAPPLDTSNSSIVRGEIATDGNLELVDGYLHIFSPDFPLPDSVPITLTLDLATGTFIVLGYPPDDPGLPSFVAFSGTGTFTLIPVPAALAMFAPTVFVLGMLRRRRGQ